MSELLQYFEDINSIGTLILLSILMFVSLLIGWWAGRKIDTIKKFLYSPGEMTSLEFGLSETAYMIAVGTTLILLPSLTFQYGSFFLVVAFFSWIISLIVYSKLALSGDLIIFYREKGAHLGEYVIGDKGEKSPSEKILLSMICIIIAFTFWLYFVAEILALRVLAIEFKPSVGVSAILGATLIFVMLYTTIGGYKGTFRTDMVQTLFFVLVLSSIIVYGFTKVRPLYFSPVMKKSIIESFIVLVSYSAIGVAALITGLDIWARMRASEGDEKRAGKSGLWWSLLALIPFLLICCFGILFSSLGKNIIGDNPNLNAIVPVVSAQIGIPLGFMLVFLISLTISTADTALITTSQAIEPIFPRRFKTLPGIRSFVVIMSLIGLVFAIAIPLSRTIQTMLLAISFPVALTPIVLVRRFSKKKRIKPNSAIVSIIVPSIIGIGIGIYNIEYAYYSAAIILILAFLFYFIGHLIEKD